MRHAMRFLGDGAPSTRACAWSLGIHTLALTLLLVCAEGPSGSGSGGRGGSAALDASWTVVVEAAGTAVEADSPGAGSVAILPAAPAIPAPEPAAAGDAFAEPTSLAPAAAPAPSAADPVAAGESGAAAASGGATGAAASGAAGGAGHGPVGTARFFSVDLRGDAERPISVVFVIDHSSSMARHDAAGVARRELLQTLEQLTLADRFQIVLYNDRPAALTVSTETQQLLRATDRHRRLAEDFLQSALVEGGTNHMAALRSALGFAPETIVLLTDGDEPALSARDRATIRGLNRQRAPIHVIEFGEGPYLEEPGSLALLAAENFGVHVYHDVLAGRTVGDAGRIR